MIEALHINDTLFTAPSWFAPVYVVAAIAIVACMLWFAQISFSEQPKRKEAIPIVLACICVAAIVYCHIGATNAKQDVLSVITPEDCQTAKVIAYGLDESYGRFICAELPTGETKIFRLTTSWAITSDHISAYYQYFIDTGEITYAMHDGGYLVPTSLIRLE